MSDDAEWGSAFKDTVPADTLFQFTPQPIDTVSLYSTQPESKVFLEVRTGGKVFIDGQETSDVERIGARFREWAKAMMPEKPR